MIGTDHQFFDGVFHGGFPDLLKEYFESRETQSKLSVAGIFQGSEAPNFKLQDENGQWVTLESIASRGPLLLVFYPGDFRMICTRQLCAYQDSMSQFQRYGMQVVAISANKPAEHKRFRDEYSFDFPLLSDPSREVCKAYGVVSLFLLSGISRAVFMLDRHRRVIYRYIEPTPLTKRDPGELLTIMEGLKAKGLI